jgi:hypothetical protein
MKGAGKKWKRVPLTIKAKTDICNRLKCGENHKKLIKEYGIGSSKLRYISGKWQYPANLCPGGAIYNRFYCKC